MKARLTALAAGSPALRPVVRTAAPRLTSVIGNRAMRAAVAGTTVPARPSLAPAAGVQLKSSTGRARGGPAGHPARAHGGGHGAAAIHASAARGVATPGSALPHADLIQRAFGHHDISSVQAHVGGAAADSAAEMEAEAYTMGEHVVLGKGADLFTEVHETAHAFQQRAGVELDGGVGVAGDRYEQHADAVAARVTAGQSAEALLDTYTGTSATRADTGAIQRKTSIVDDATDPQNTTQKGSGRGLLKDSAGNIRSSQDYVFGPLQDDCGTFMHAWIDPLNYDPSGTEPKTGTWPNWWAANAPQINNYWVRGHLLNHNLGGPGEKRNLTPITKKANKEHHDQVENAVKQAAAAGASFIDYTVTAGYDSDGPDLDVDPQKNPNPAVWDKLTTHFQCEFTIVDNVNNTETMQWGIFNEH